MRIAGDYNDPFKIHSHKLPSAAFTLPEAESEMKLVWNVVHHYLRQRQVLVIDKASFLPRFYVKNKEAPIFWSE